jgi:hypothetical protein
LFSGNYALAESFNVIYGEKLDTVPYAIKASYLKYYEKPWEEATFDERNDYLNVLKKEEILQKKTEFNESQIEKRLEAQKEKAKLDLKKAEEKKVKDREKEKQLLIKAEIKKNEHFNKKTKDQVKKINKMRQKAKKSVVRRKI